MKNLVDELNRLKNACDAEDQLRVLANYEFNRREYNGPMKNAHDKQILEVINAAKELILKSEEEE